MARPKKTAVEKQQPAPVPMPPQHIQQYPQHPQPIAAVPQAMAVPMPAAIAAPPQAVMPQRVVDNDSFLRVRDSVSLLTFIWFSEILPPTLLGQQRAQVLSTRPEESSGLNKAKARCQKARRNSSLCKFTVALPHNAFVPTVALH